MIDKEIEYLTIKSKELIDKQINSYRQLHSYAGTIIGIVSLFIPFFLNGLTDSYLCIQLISIIPITLFIITILIMLNILRSRPLEQSISVDRYSDLVNKSFRDILLFDLGVNLDSYRANKAIILKSNSHYNTGIMLTIISIIISILLLLSNIFFKPAKAIVTTKVQITNLKNMENNRYIDSNKVFNNNPQPIVIPPTTPADREKMNEGVDRPLSPTPTPKPSTTGK